MTNPRVLYPIFLKCFFVLFSALSLAACSTEDSVTDSQVDTPVGNQSIALSWVAPVEREDGTPITMAEIAGYRVYYSNSQGDYTNEVDIAGSDNMQVTLNKLVQGTYYIVVTTYDIDGRQSAYSQVVTKTV